MNIELTRLGSIPLETEITIKWSSGKGKYDKLRNSQTIFFVILQQQIVLKNCRIKNFLKSYLII